MSCKADICPCQYTNCPRRGKCCECVQKHRKDEVNPLPACLKEENRIR